MFCFISPSICKRWGVKKPFFARSAREIVPHVQNREAALEKVPILSSLLIPFT